MIKLDRGKAPAGWNDLVRDQHTIARQFFASSDGFDSGPEDFPFDPGIWNRVAPDLATLTDGKCAYCESRVSSETEPMVVSHFRPTRSARGHDGTTAAAHYYWLAYTWSNLHPACVTCNRTKHDRFPVERERCPVDAPQKVIADEQRLLIDPFVDQPANYLLFTKDGFVTDVRDAGVVGLQARVLPQRALTSIETFGLNRKALVRMRRTAIEQTIERIDDLIERHDGAFEDIAFGPVVSSRTEFAMARRQAAFRHLVQRFPGYSHTRLGRKTSVLSPIAREALAATRPVRVTTRSRVADREKAVKHASIDSTTTYARSSQVEQIRLHDFRRIDDIEIDFASSGWTMLVGENGAGKSSVLQAIAIALMGRERARQYVANATIRPADLVRNGRRRARIELQRVADVEPLVVDITESGISFPTTREQQAIVLGFGASRWPSRPGARPADRGKFARASNLFNPFVPLADPEVWLLENRRTPARFRSAVQTLARLLDFGPTDRFRYHRGRIYVASENRPMRTLDQLSDGYQTVLAMSVAMMEPLLQKFDEMRTAEGVVLIDELDAHLHPRWKMRIVGDLRRAFPGLQFVATTHEPLCLRGLAGHEIRVMEAVEGTTIVRSDAPDPASMSVEQLLTSTMFGLYTTLDPERERQLDRFYDLLSRRRLDDGETAELARLRVTIGEPNLLGDSPRDQLVYKIADEAVALGRHEAGVELTPDAAQAIATSVSKAVRGLEPARRNDLRRSLRAIADAQRQAAAKTSEDATASGAVR